MKTLPTENPIEALVEYTERYSETSFKLLKLQLLEQSTFITTLIITRMVVVVMFIFFSVLGSIGIALWAGALLDKLYLGFFIVAVCYLLAGIIFHSYLYRWIKKPVSNVLIRQALQ